MPGPIIPDEGGPRPPVPDPAEAPPAPSGHAVDDGPAASRAAELVPAPPTGPTIAEDAGAERFSLGLVLDVAKILDEHGYDVRGDSRALVELQQHLFCFLHGRADCTGGAL